MREHYNWSVGTEAFYVVLQATRVARRRAGPGHRPEDPAR